MLKKSGKNQIVDLQSLAMDICLYPFKDSIVIRIIRHSVCNLLAVGLPLHLLTLLDDGMN